MGGEGIGRSELLRLCHETVKWSVKTCSPYFRNQLYGGVDEVGLAGSWLTEALNTNQCVSTISSGRERASVRIAPTRGMTV